MKAISKKMMVLSLAGLIYGAGAGLAGCDKGLHDNNEKIISDYVSGINLSNAYIVVNENGVETLHKGDLIERSWNYGEHKGAAMTPLLKFNCGKELQTYQFVAYSQGYPSEENYDAICDCAQITLQSQENGKNESTKNTKAFATGRVL